MKSAVASRSAPKPHPILLGVGMALLISLAAGAAPAREISEGFSETVDDLVPAVVAIATTQTVETGQAAPSLPEDSPFREYFEDFFGRRGGGERQLSLIHISEPTRPY